MKHLKLLPALALLALLLTFALAEPALAGSGIPARYYVRDSNTSITSLSVDFGLAQHMADERVSAGEKGVTLYLNESYAWAFNTRDFYLGDGRWFTGNTVTLYASSIDLRDYNLHTRLDSGSKSYYDLSVKRSDDITIRNGSIYANDITISGRVRLYGVNLIGRKSAGDTTSKVTLTVPRDGELWIYDNCSFDNVNLVIEEGGTVRVYGTGNTLNGDFTNRGTLTELGNITVDGDVKNYASGRITTGTFQRFVENWGTIHQYSNKTTFNAAVVNYPGGTITGGTFNRGVSNSKGATIGKVGDAVYGYIPVFNGTVTNLGTINLGTFNSDVINRKDATIAGGTYAGRVNNIGTISGGTFTGEAASETAWARTWGATSDQTQGGQFTVTGGDFSKAKRHGIYEVRFDLQGGTDSYGS